MHTNGMKRTRSTPLDPNLMFWCVSCHLYAFGTVKLPYETRGKTGRTSAKVCATKSNWNFSRKRTRSTPYDPKLMFWCVSNHLGAFGTVRLPYKTRCKTSRMCKSSCHEVTSEFFAMNPPDPLHWSLNSYFGAFRTIWVHLRSFGCLTKLGAKRSELVQKFGPRSRVGVFHDERTRSTPLEPKLMFWCVSYHLGPLCFLTKLRAKRSELVQKFVPRSRVGILRNEHIRSTPLDPKLLFCCVLYHLGAFGTVKLPYESRGKTFRTSAKVRDTKSRRSLSRRAHPIHPIGP